MSSKHITYNINLIGGPGCGKTTMCALVFAKLKLKHKIAEYVQEYAKQLVWKKDYDTLNNQYYVTRTQYEFLKSMQSEVEFIVTDGPLCQGLYYNLHNPNNISNIDKTQNFIMNSFNEFNNINLFIKRGTFEYEQQGRMQTEEESKEIDVILKHLLKQNNIPFQIVDADASDENINNIVNYILDYVESSNNKKVGIVN